MKAFYDVFWHGFVKKNTETAKNSTIHFQLMQQNGTELFMKFTVEFDEDTRVFEGFYQIEKYSRIFRQLLSFLAEPL